MKFLCLICAEKMMEQMTEADAATHFEDYREFTAAIRKSGHFAGCNRLLPPHAATRSGGGNWKVSATNGRCAGTKGRLGGYCVIEASARDEAVQVAARMPGAWIGCVEVRPIAEDERTLRALGFAAR